MPWRKKIERAFSFRSRWREFCAIVPSCTGLSLLAGLTGIYQPLEFLLYDSYLHWRPAAPSEQRILVVGISDTDIQTVGEWPLSDRVLATTLRKLVARQPHSIGLDLYRDLQVGEGYAELEEVLHNERVKVFGVEKGIDNIVGPPPALVALHQEEPRIGLADLVLDSDNRVRRGIVSIMEAGNERFGLGSLLALDYLAGETQNGEPIRPVPQGDARGSVRIGRSVLSPLHGNSGAYVRADAGGYQILIDYRDETRGFDVVSLTEVLTDTLAADRVRGKIVLIGSVAESSNDLFQTPFTNRTAREASSTPGVFIHAQITSQLLSSAIDGRSPIATIPELGEWGFALFWGIAGLFLSKSLPTIRRSVTVAAARVIGVYAGACAALLGTGFALFLGGVWVPLIPALTAMTAALICGIIYQNQTLKLQANYDRLTGVANRHHLEFYLVYKLNRTGAAAFILFDVDYFKKFNDTYGHQLGDVCLQAVARVIRGCARNRDLVARYGGEEFIAILPGADASTAWEFAENVRLGVKALQLDVGDRPSPSISISCGIATIAAIESTWPPQAIARADKALYRAKRDGRDRAIAWTPELEENAAPLADPLP